MLETVGNGPREGPERLKNVPQRPACTFPPCGLPHVVPQKQLDTSTMQTGKTTCRGNDPLHQEGPCRPGEPPVCVVQGNSFIL